MLIVYCLHGDEIITEKIAKKFNKKYGIAIYIGNPAARKKKVRFIEADLNRSFNKDGSLEAERSKIIKRDLLQKNENIIIDLHATTAIMPITAIVTNLNQLKLVSKTGIKKVIFMSEDFSSGGSLIENIPNSISLEIHPDRKSIKQLELAIESVINEANSIDEFEVYKVIEIVNFKQLRDGTYPLFSGEDAYKKVKFLKANKQLIKLSDLK